MFLDYLIVILLSVFAVASVIWYFRMRKKTLLLTKKVTEQLEKEFKPVDKTYVLLGYLVGYRAKYVLENGDRVYILLTTAPRHSLIYYPISKALRRRDKMELAIENARRYVVRELHVVHTKERWAQAVIDKDLGSRAETMSKRILETPSGEYIVYYEDSGDLELTKKLLSVEGVRIYKLSAYKKFNLVSITAELGENSVLAIVRLLREFNRYITAGIRT